MAKKIPPMPEWGHVYTVKDRAISVYYPGSDEFEQDGISLGPSGMITVSAGQGAKRRMAVYKSLDDVIDGKIAIDMMGNINHSEDKLDK